MVAPELMNTLMQIRNKPVDSSSIEAVRYLQSSDEHFVVALSIPGAESGNMSIVTLPAVSEIVF
jgi:isocitrate dehydrogenase kinase/phosphatase